MTAPSKYIGVAIMAKEFDLIAEIREDVGKGSSRRLRHAGKVPAVIYGAGRPPRSLIFDENKILRELEKESFFSSVLTVKVGAKSQATILKDIQMHPAKRRVMHLDLQRIVADEKIKMAIPFHFLNEETCPGVKDDGGTVSHTMTEVDITCLPKDLPEYIEIDVGEMELDTMLHLSEVVLPAGVEIPELAQGNDQAVLSVHILRVKEEVEEEVEAVEGEEAAEGEEGAEAEGDSDSGEAKKGDD
jgi:large subunit ribosomal protein L25